MAQKEFTFTQRRDILRRLPTRTTDEKHLIRILDDHAGDGSDCWLKLSTIAAEMGCSTRTVQRAIQDAIEDEYLIVIPKHMTDRPCNTYRLRRAEMRDKSGLARDLAEHEAEGGVGDNLASTTCQVVTDYVPSWRPVGDNLASSKKPPLKPPIKPPLKPCDRTLFDPPRPDGTDGVLKSDFGGWGVEITIDTLKRPSEVQKLFERAQANWGLLPADRLRFFSVATSLRRRAEKPGSKIDDVGKAFSGIIKNRLWQQATGDDEDRARRALRYLDVPPEQRRRQSEEIEPDPRQAMKQRLAEKMALTAGNR